MTDGHTLEQWGRRSGAPLRRQAREAISATGLEMNRSGFGQIIRPAPGSVLASPSVAFGQGEPDYFFHWVRDSAAVMDAVRILAKAGETVRAIGSGSSTSSSSSAWICAKSTASAFSRQGDFRAKTAPDMQQFLAPRRGNRRRHGTAFAGDVRYNADGSLDFIRWNRPQHDGPASRALVAMRFEEDGPLCQARRRRRAWPSSSIAISTTPPRMPGTLAYDIWEEEFAQHYYTLLVQLAAMEKGAARAERGGIAGEAAFFSAKAGICASRSTLFGPRALALPQPHARAGRRRPEGARFRGHPRGAACGTR